MRNCEYCNKSFEPKRENHKYCKTTCRVKAYRQRNNIEEPEFLRQNKIGQVLAPSIPPTLPNPKQDVPTNQDQVAIRDFDKDLRMLESQLRYWKGVLADSKHGIVPAGFLAGTVIGAATSKEDDISNFGLGMILGAAFDQLRKNSIEKQALYSIETLKTQISNLKQIKTSFKRFEVNNILSKPHGRSKVRTILSAKEYRDAEIPEIPFTGKWKYLIGNPQEGFHTMLHGKPGQGKTSFALQFADYFDRIHGKTIYLTAEQKGLNKSFQSALRRFAPNAKFDIHTEPPKSLNDLIKSIGAFKLAILDSIDHLGLNWADIKEIKEQCPKTALVTIHHSTKEGRFKGGQELEHECDISIRMENFIAHQTKSRFAAPAKLELKEA